MDNLILYNTDYRKKRIGRNYDGGYVMCELPGTYDCFISGGISNDISFEQAFLDINLKMPCFAFDGTIQNLPMKDDRIVFVKKNLGENETNDVSNLTTTMENYSNIFMKIDIEGHEFRLFPTFSEDRMRKIKQLVVEIHSPGDIQLFPDYFKGLSDINHSNLIDLFRNINKTHTLVHVHPNNGCQTYYAEGVHLPNVFECTFIRNDFVHTRIRNKYSLPFPIDMPNVPTKPIVQFNDYPFVSKKKTLVIVGPGFSSIPPIGWGAVESLVWDYKIFLNKYHNYIHVEIVNEPDKNNMIQKINSLNPDIVHIQYDDHIDIVPYLTCDNIYATQHYAYLDHIMDPKHNFYYRTHFLTTVKSTSKLLCLSPSIANMFRINGAKESRLFVQRNGANDELFRFTNEPFYNDRSIYVAKVTERKRQHVYQNLNMLYFAGNLDNSYKNRFNENNPRYLGEWTKAYLYEHLTDYANLVLLSDGEAHPLVCCEALMAGLGLVVSECAIAHLDVSMPFIDVIPNDKLDDVEYVANVVLENQKKSVCLRDEIRKYGIEKFSWKKVVDDYVGIFKVQGLL
jgi:hypothetical protein